MMPVHPPLANVEAGTASARLAEANNPSSKVLHLPASEPLLLDCDQSLAPLSIAYQTYGTLNAAKSNAMLVCHALTGDQYVASEHPVTRKPGWWETLVGPGKPMDTDRFFVICSNILGGCMGSTGPASINPRTGKPYGLNFPVITIGDMVNAQVRLIDHLGHRPAVLRDRRVDGRHAGARMGGAPHRARVLRRADRDRRLAFLAEHRLPRSRPPGRDGRPRLVRRRLLCFRSWCRSNGLAVARMAAHITYLSEEALHRKFGRSLQDRSELTFSFNADFQVESYLRHQGSTFVDRFDANSYLYITRAMDYFDMLPKARAACWRTPSAARRRASASSRSHRLAVSDAREPRNRAGAECSRG